MRPIMVISWINFQNYVGGYMTYEDVEAAAFNTPLPDDEGFGPLDVKEELLGTEVIVPKTSKRKFSMWRTRRPSGFGFLISKYNFKLYFFRWTLGIGWIPEEVVWQRQERISSQEQSSERVQSAI